MSAHASLGPSRSTRLAAALVVLLLSACGEGPEEAYERLVFHARTGNEAAFLDGFTEPSRKLARTLIGLRRTYGDLVDRDADPYLSLVLERVENVETETREVPGPDGLERIKAKVATLSVTDGRLVRKLVMIETKDGWKIDALALQKLWAEDRRAFSSR